MSFTTVIKDEITKIETTSLEDAISLHSYIKLNGNIENNKISIMVENASVARWIFKIIKSNYNININLTHRVIKRFKERNLYILSITEKKSLIEDNINNLFKDIKEGSFEEKAAFLKGMFLSCGSINDPKKNQYHLEFLIKEENIANLVNSIILDLNIDSKILKREREYMVYVKKSEHISDFIKMLGATNSLFYFEDIRIYKDHKNMVNRLNNCEQANVEKSIKSSQQIINNINYIEENNLITLIEGRTLDVINYKKTYPETSLTELAEIITLETGKPITKSGVNHHFRKISTMIKTHKENS